VRNNQDRLSGLAVPNAAQEPPVQQQQTEQQPLQFVTPTEFVELPSAGQLYPEGHPLHGVQTIEIRHMTAKDEDILTSRSLLKKGVAIDRLLQNIIVDRSIKVSDLLIGDKNAIIVACRVNGYGSDYEAKIVCPSCTTSVDFNFDLSLCEMNPHDAYKHWGIEKTVNNTFVIHAEKTGVDVEIRLLNSKDEVVLSQLSEKRRKNKLPESNLTNQLRRIIVSVDGNNNPAYVDSFVQNMPAVDSRLIRRTYQKIAPNIDMIQDFICSECDFEGEVNVPFGANFFWPKQ